MPRCARPSCGHYRRAHADSGGACRKRPRGHCGSFVVPTPAPPPEPVPDIVIEPGTDLRAAIHAGDPGDRVKLLAGVHELRDEVRPKPGMVIDWRGAAIRCVGARSAFRLKIRPGEGVEDVTFLVGDLGYADERGIVPWIGTRILGGRIHHCAEMGIGCDPEGLRIDLLVDGTELDQNGSDAELGPSAAGMKMFHAIGVTVRNAYVHDNYGNGLWWDFNSAEALVEESLIERNYRKGVFWEKCGKSVSPFTFEGPLVVRRNRIVENDVEGVPQANAGVSSYASRNVLVEDNDFGGNGRAIIYRNDPKRVADDKPGFVMAAHVARDNRLNGDEIVGCGEPGVTCERNAA